MGSGDCALEKQKSLGFFWNGIIKRKKNIGHKEYPNSTNEAISGLEGKYTS